ncbi:MAG: DUF4351 domain-containing protein, partial [Candidatus Saccharimonadales bacterium]
LMRVPKERRIALAGEALQRLVHCPENGYRKTLICECVNAYLPTGEEQRRQFEDMVRNHPDPGVQAMELDFLDHVELRGKLELLLRQLETRFGPLPASVVAELQTWSSDRLTDLGCALLSAKSLRELGLDVSEAGGG